MDPVYLDHAATTPLEPAALRAMLPFLGERFGNASSVHARGRAARHAVESSRQAIAAALGTRSEAVWITSGGTEANNTVVRGVAALRQGAIVTGATEHESVLRGVERLRDAGRETVVLPPGGDGVIDPEAVLRVVREREVALVSIMRANNETGALSPIGAIAAVCREHGVPLHTDAVQAAAFEPSAPERTGAGFVTVSAHKLGGPVGVGAILAGSDFGCEPLIVGGGQERGLRAGTENVAAVAGFAEAARIVAHELEADSLRVTGLRDRLADGLERSLGDWIAFTVPRDRCAPHILHCTFPGREGRRVDGEMLLLRLDMEGVQASAGSACSSGAVQPSHVLIAMGFPADRAASALRLSLGRNTTEDEIERAIPVIARTVRRVTA